MLHEQFRSQADKTPDRIALHENAGARSITYAELDARSSRVAAALAMRDIGAGAVVGLHLERSIDWVVALLGILKTNAAVMPLPPSYPGGRLRDILEHAQLDAVIDGADTPLHAAPGQRIVHVEDALTTPEPLARSTDGDATQPAFVLASSGSTGTPKMIMRSHASFHHRLAWTWDQHPYADGEVCCQKSHATTTHGIYELFEPLLRGVPTVIIPDHEVRDLEGFRETIRARGITRLLIVPSMLQSSLDLPGFVAPPLKVIVLMGEYLSPRLAERALAALAPATGVYSIYGSTEASSTLVCDIRASFVKGRELPLGKAIASSIHALVLTDRLEPVAPGDAGRLYIAGPALFSGYFRAPEQTAAVIVQDPRTGERLYDTHDQVRQLPDGTLEFLGRTDDTVKIRGFRVDLGEVERALLGHAGVQQAAAVVTGIETGNVALHAFVTPASIDVSAVYATLRSTLAPYMVPSTLVALDAFPLTARGKLDRAQLMSQLAARRAESVLERALSDTERRIADVWEATLRNGTSSPDQSFFEAGGTSLTVFALVARLRTAFALDRQRLSEQVVYGSPTIAGLATYIDRVLRGDLSLTQKTPLLVTLRQGAADRAPFFLIASAGGTLGAYDKLSKTLTTSREIIGVRDPYVWGDRDIGESFSTWVDHYVAAIRERQPRGPYYLGAYSSAGAFGFEIAQRLRASGETVAILVLVDPLGLDHAKGRYGWSAMEAIWHRAPVRQLIRLAGWLRVPLHRIGAIKPSAPAGLDLPPAEVERVVVDATRDKSHLQTFAATLELNTGLPLSLTDADFAGRSADGYFDLLKSRIAREMPDVDLASIERIATQYVFQVRAQNAYHLRPYDGDVLLLEPNTRHVGLATAHLKAYVKRLASRAIPIGVAEGRVREVSRRFGKIEAHYRSMRDDQFVQGAAKEIDAALDHS